MKEEGVEEQVEDLAQVSTLRFPFSFYILMILFILCIINTYAYLSYHYQFAQHIEYLILLHVSKHHLGVREQKDLALTTMARREVPTYLSCNSAQLISGTT